jgi:hypothetical protein
METLEYDGKAYQRIKAANGSYRYKVKSRNGGWRELNAVRNAKLVAIINSILLTRSLDA